MSDEFEDYEFFIWGMFVTFEEFKDNNSTFVLYSRGKASKFTMEFSNKIGESMKKRGYQVLTKYFNGDDKIDYRIHFRLRGHKERMPAGTDKEYVL